MWCFPNQTAGCERISGRLSRSNSSTLTKVIDGTKQPMRGGPKTFLAPSEMSIVRQALERSLLVHLERFFSMDVLGVCVLNWTEGTLSTDFPHRTPTQQPSLSLETPEKQTKKPQNVTKQPNKQQRKLHIIGYHFYR